VLEAAPGHPRTDTTDKADRVRRRPVRKLELDEALMALFIGAMNANSHVAREELDRAHHLIWSTRRFCRKSDDTVGRLIDRMKRMVGVCRCLRSSAR